MWLPMRHAPRSSVFLNSRQIQWAWHFLLLWDRIMVPEKMERIRTGIREGVILTILINIPLALMLLCIPEFLTSFMLNDASIISYTKDFLAVTGICLFPLGWLFVFRNGCQGMGHTFVPMLSGVLEVSLRVVMVKLLTPYLAFRGVALAEVSAWIGAWIMLMITYWIYQERTDSFR